MRPNEITHVANVAPEVYEMNIYAPDVARRIKAGQFIIIRVDDAGERIPLSVGDFDAETGILELLIREIGLSTKKLVSMLKGQTIPDLVGPLGKPTEILPVKHLVCVGGGVGIAPVHVVAKAYRAKGVKVTTVFGARSSNLLAWKDKVRKVSDNLIITTDDGSEGIKGVVTAALEAEINRSHPELVFTAGPAIMMKFVTQTTKKLNVRSIASLNPIMVDGTGMCGGCRVSVAGKTQFACVDGPDFEGNEVDFDELMMRQRTYCADEKLAVDHHRGHAAGSCGCGRAREV